MQPKVDQQLATLYTLHSRRKLTHVRAEYVAAALEAVHAEVSRGTSHAGHGTMNTMH